MLIVYGATAGVSVVKLYAGAFFPGIMLAVLYIVYVMIRAKLNPKLAPPLSAEDRVVALSAVPAAVATAPGQQRARPADRGSRTPCGNHRAQKACSRNCWWRCCRPSYSACCCWQFIAP